jgi:hypothetical protein
MDLRFPLAIQRWFSGPRCLWLPWSLLVLASCSELGDRPRDVTLDPGPALDTQDSGFDADLQDGLPDSPTDTSAADILGSLLSPCTAAAECASGTCLTAAGLDVCTRACADDCPKGWQCLEVAFTVPGSRLCVPDSWALCRPCATDADCVPSWGVKGTCVVYSALGRFCGLDCAVDGDCPDGYACRDAKSAGGVSSRQCTFETGECPCSPQAIKLGLATTCAKTSAFGTCTGRRTCQAAGLGPCDAPEPVAEVCNTKDDDCDGLVNEDSPDCCVCGDGKCDGGAPCSETLETCPFDCHVCGDGRCSPTESPDACPEDCCVCGDGRCVGFKCQEDALKCPKDCVGACGDHDCQPGEDPVSCPQDCGVACGNKLCENGENSKDCPDDCGNACGDGKCDPDEGTWACPVDCGYCGDHVCSTALGETAPTCPMDCALGVCGNGICEPGEVSQTCPGDCKPGCGDCACGTGETSLACPVDCGYCGDGVCSQCLEETGESCTKDCA